MCAAPLWAKTSVERHASWKVASAHLAATNFHTHTAGIQPRLLQRRFGPTLHTPGTSRRAVSGPGVQRGGQEEPIFQALEGFGPNLLLEPIEPPPVNTPTSPGDRYLRETQCSVALTCPTIALQQGNLAPVL
ncbi:unnamed protein product [Ectocarpus sp. 4 AP-2014]